MAATTNIPEQAKNKLRSAVEEAADDEPIVLWWDEGGYLRDLIDSLSEELGHRFYEATETPLELRRDVPEETTVWYVPFSDSTEYDWFRDVENTGTEVECHVGMLAEKCFADDRLAAASLRSAFESAEVNDSGEDERDRIARTYLTELGDEGGQPSLKALQTEIVTEGYDDPIRFVLEQEADSLPDGDKLQQIRDLIESNGVEAVHGLTEPEEIVRETRKAAVAEWLVDLGVDENEFSQEYRPNTSSTGFSKPHLQSVFDKTQNPKELAEKYLGGSAEYWSDVLTGIDDIWSLVNCPADAALEHALWRGWKAEYEDKGYEECSKRARQRTEVLESRYGDVVWTEVWRQAINVAELAEAMEAWEELDDPGDVVELYGDHEDGTWRIDNGVFNLVVSGEPEEHLHERHPASDDLEELRDSLVENRYLSYMRELADLTTEQLSEGSPFRGENQMHQFFAENQDSLQSGRKVALFIVDALRYDLAHQLAESIREDVSDVEVDENRWVGVLPSETSFGKGALTPGGKFNFSVKLKDGNLVPSRKGEITNHHRESLLAKDGWSYIQKDTGDKADWNHNRVAFYWNDIDSMGESELEEFESLFVDRLDRISDIIKDKLSQGEWDQVYVLSDHGFVSLPETPDIDKIYPPDGYDTVKRRWSAGRDIEHASEGVVLDETTELGYLEDDTDVNILVDPIQRFRNHGVDDARFFHGGALPQEFVLNFLTITPR